MPTRIAKQVRPALFRAERVWDSARFRVKARLGIFRQPKLMPYRGFGDGSQYWVKGRVVEAPNTSNREGANSLARNLWLTFKRYETDEVPGAKLRWHFGRLTGEVEADEEGLFEFAFEPGSEHRSGEAWQTVDIELLDSPVPGTQRHSAKSPVRTPAPDASFGIISDVDDTIIKSGVTQLAKHWRILIANSAKERVAFPGLAAFYRGLVGEGERNPIFYVSSSPWNLFDLLEEFMSFHEIPLGPMLLKDFGLSQSRWLAGGHHDYKMEMIEGLLDRYPRLPFLFIGDSGQRDAFVARDLAERHPGRIAAIYIREIDGGSERDAVQQALEAAERLGVDTACGPDLWVAAQHAAERGWLPDEDLARVHREIQQAQSASSHEDKPRAVTPGR